MATMSREEILSRIQTDPGFAIRFGLDNNPDGILRAMQRMGLSVQSTDQALQILDSLVSGDQQKLLNVLSRVPYINDSSNYTGGFLDYFKSRTRPDQIDQARADLQMSGGRYDFNIDAVLAGLGAALSTYSGYQAATQAPAPTDPSAAAAAAAAAAAKAAEEEKKKKQRRTMWWIIGGTAAVIIIGLVIYFATRGAKAAPAAD